MPTTIEWENICEKCARPVNVIIKTHCSNTIYSLVIHYNEMNSLDLRRNEYVDGTPFCKGCVPTASEIFSRQCGIVRGQSRALTSGDIKKWMSEFNKHFDREDCLLDLPEKITVNINKLANLKIRDPLYEIYFNHVLYIRDGEY
jgi:hypothetical protein